MTDKKGAGDDNRDDTSKSEDETTAKERLRDTCARYETPSEEDLALGRIDEAFEALEENVSGSDEIDQILEAEYQRLNEILGLPEDTYSLTKIDPILPSCVNYGVRSGRIHFRMSTFSPLSRGLQGPACAVAGYATNSVLESRCWNEIIIDRIIEDGDTYYCKSYDNIETNDRRTLTVRDLRKKLVVQNTHEVHIDVDHAAYAGKFRSEDPKELHIAKALQLFFKRYDSCILTSDVLNVAIWKDCKFFNVFDGQARNDNCVPISGKGTGAAKLMVVRDLTGLVFMILEKSKVKNEPFVLYAIHSNGTHKLPTHPDDPEEPFKSIGEPKRRPSGYIIQEQFRALIQGTYHLLHPKIPEEIRGHGHLIIAVAAIVYSRLINSNKWSSVMIDLIFNHARVYMIDLVRALGKKLDESLQLNVEDLASDVILGVYSAKVKVTANLVPGQRKKGKLTIETGLREFFQQNECGILEIRKVFYAVWKEGEKFYFLDPFGCDDEGFRVDPNDLEEAVRYKTAKPCVTMNSSLQQVVETILENTGSKEKDAFFIHGIRVLYVKTGNAPDSSMENVIYREKNTNRRPLPLEGTEDAIEVIDEECRTRIDPSPKPRLYSEKWRDEETQFPELMKGVEEFTMRPDEPTSFVVAQTEADPKPTIEARESNPATGDDRSIVTGTSEVEEAKSTEEPETELKRITGYRIVNPRRLVLQGSKNCLAKEFEERARGRQGTIIALTALAYGKMKAPASWRNIDVNQIIDVGDKAHGLVVDWIRRGSPSKKESQGEKEDGEDDEDSEESEEDEDEEEEESSSESDQDDEEEPKRYIRRTPSHLDLSMLPDTIKLGENEVSFKNKLNVAEGDANPLVNLGEALQHYLKRYDDLIVENKRLTYGVWKAGEKYYLFNPYGGDKEGRRMRGHPATLIVTDTINELTDVFYEILEYNDPKFFLHFVGIESIQPNHKYVAPTPVTIPENEAVLRYKTVFLPVSDEDLFVPEPEKQIEQEVVDRGGEKAHSKSDDEKRNDDDEEDDEEDESDDDTSTESSSSMRVSEPEVALVDPLMEVEEQDQPDHPRVLNLYLLARNVPFDISAGENPEEPNEALIYEKLKYNHPPPYVSPPKKVLCTLLRSKEASKSAHSLLSRFSIDSKLSVKGNTGQPEDEIITAIDLRDGDKMSKLIRLPPKKYLVSRILPNGFVPIRAIDDTFIRNEDSDKAEEEECRKNRLCEAVAHPMMEPDPEKPDTMRMKPVIIPVGPPIKTPTPTRGPRACISQKKRRCKIHQNESQDPILEKIACNTEDLLLDMMFPDPEAKIKEKYDARSMEASNENEQEESQNIGIRVKDSEEKLRAEPLPERRGFATSKEESVGMIRANTCMVDRNRVEECHLKQCYYAAILCILAKVRLEVNNFRGSILDEFILGGGKIFQRTGKLRYKSLRWFNSVEVRDATFNITMKQILYADPENCPEEELSTTLSSYLKNNQSGILIFSTASYAFWTTNGFYYLFDPYACDEEGRANDDGFACLMRFSEFDALVTRIELNTGESSPKPYRVHAMAISHMNSIVRKKSRERKALRVSDERITRLDSATRELEPVSSLIELREWLIDPKRGAESFDPKRPGFVSIPYLNASALEVMVVEDDVTDPIRTEFKKPLRVRHAKSRGKIDKLERKEPYVRTFREHAAIFEPLDLCIMAWSYVRDPKFWGTRTIRGLFEAGLDFAYESHFAVSDTTTDGMTDGLLPEFTIANYTFHVNFVRQHHGTLYATEGWNLAMSLKKILSTPIYSGAIIICNRAHIGVMKRNGDYYAWWGVLRTKNLKVVASEELEDLLKLIVREINVPERTTFSIRIVTISHARKTGPDCDDSNGLHERVVPATSFAEIHRKEQPPYDIDAIFRKTVPEKYPIFVRGTVALRNRHAVREPRVKRCYFTALLAVMVKRDIVQSTVPGMIDKVIEIAERLYQDFDDPKYHTEHVLKNMTIMNRMFDFRDCASALFPFVSGPGIGTSENFASMKKALKSHFKKHSDGMIHFTNCCYGFWFSRSTNAYYYLDPYQCDDKGRSVENGGNSCLCIFPTCCTMARHMFQNCSEDTTGFFIHRLHVEFINVPPSTTFREDPMWVYLDFHWSFSHSPMDRAERRAKRRCNDPEKPSWNHYAIEVPSSIYSVWGTLGCYDPRFGQRGGKNQTAICVAVIAMQFLCHPSRWGPAILDSAVICGDCYYTESLRSAARRGCRYPNRFNLQPTLNVSPHVWTIEFLEDLCGILYGGNGRRTLAVTLKIAFDKAPNIILECSEAVFSVLAMEDGFYVADPRWTGPPLFSRNHGALYVLRCRNFNSLVYAITKMLNTNLRLEFHVTPVAFTFGREDCRGGNVEGSHLTKRIMTKVVNARPARACRVSSPIPGSITTPDADSYFRYQNSLEPGVTREMELEGPSEPDLRSDNINNALISTKWHVNLGRPTPRKHSKKLVEYCEDLQLVERNKPWTTEKNRSGYPKLLNLVEGVNEPLARGAGRTPASKKDSVTFVPMNRDEFFCGGERSFIAEIYRREFKKQTEDMASSYYKTYRHRIPVERDASEAKTTINDETEDGAKSETTATDKL